MGQLMYTMQFKGQAAPVSGATGVMKATTTATSCSITTVVGPAGVQGTLQPAAGGQATFESQVTLTGENAFQEVGSITFGAGGHRVHFSTVGQGYIGPSAEPGLPARLGDLEDRARRRTVRGGQRVDHLEFLRERYR